MPCRRRKFLGGAQRNKPDRPPRFARPTSDSLLAANYGERADGDYTLRLCAHASASFAGWFSGANRTSSVKSVLAHPCQSAIIIKRREMVARTGNGVVPATEHGERRAAAVERLDVRAVVEERERAVRDCFRVPVSSSLMLLPVAEGGGWGRTGAGCRS